MAGATVVSVATGLLAGLLTADPAAKVRERWGLVKSSVMLTVHTAATHSRRTTVAVADRGLLLILRRLTSLIASESLRAAALRTGPRRRYLFTHS